MATRMTKRVCVTPETHEAIRVEKEAREDVDTFDGFLQKLLEEGD